MSFIKVYQSGSQIVIEDNFKGTTEKFERGDLEYVQNSDSTIGLNHIGRNKPITIGFPATTYQNQAGTPYANYTALSADWDSFFQPASSDDLLTELQTIATNTAGTANTSAVDSNNSSVAALGSGVEFTGTWTDVTIYHGLTVSADGTSAGTANGTLFMEFSHDGVTVHRSIEIVIDDITAAAPRTLGVITKYFRVRYKNGSTAQTTFTLQTMLHVEQVFLVSRLDQELKGTDDVQNVRAVITGANKAGEFKNAVSDSEGHLKVHLHDPRTAFGEIKTAENTIILNAKFPYNINTRLFNVTETNGGTVTQADSMAVLQTNTGTDGEAILETKGALKYTPGVGVEVKFTALFTTGIADNSQLIGYGDDTDGFFIGYVGTQFGIVRRQNGVDNFTAQSAFSVDKLDGTGVNNPSAINLDPTKGNVFKIKFQWLGFGAITFYCEDSIEGDFEPFHIIGYANNNTVPSIYNPTLPMRLENINSNGNTTNVTMKTGSLSGSVEGKRLINGPTFSHSKTASTSTPHGFSIRNKATFAGKTNRTSVFIKLLSLINDGTSSTTYILEEDASLTGGAWNDIDTNTSIVEYNDTATISGAGTNIIQFPIVKNTGTTEDLRSQFIELRPGQTLTIRTSNGNSSELALSWNEDI